MSNQFQVILRATNDKGRKFDLEVVDSPDFLLDISAIEIGTIGSVFGISSQNFTLPGNDNNNQFFNNVFDLGTTPAVALNKSVPCQVLVDGQAVFTGKLYINDVVSDEYNNVIYNCVVTNETVDFRVLTENQGLAELNWAPYSHSYSYASISQSWNDQLFSGSIFYPLVNYGANPLDSSTPGFELGGAKYQMDNVTTPLKVSQFKPAVQAKTIVDEIFKKINYKYTSSFFNTQLFKDLYFLNSVDDKDGISFVNASSGSYVYTNATQSVASGFTTLTPTKLVFNQTVYNAGSNFNLATDAYTADYTGNHIININIPFNITSNIGPLSQTKAGRQLVLYIVDGTTFSGTRLHTSKTPLTKSTSGVINTGNISVSLTAGQTISFFFALQSPSSNGIEQFTTVVSAGQNGVYAKVTTPQNPIGGTVDVSKLFGDLKTLDFMKSLIEKFNLVIEPVENQKNILRIEPYNDWINLGSQVDWTNIVDRSVKYSVAHPIQQLPQKFTFSDAEDADVLNQYQKTAYGNIYGAYNYLTDSDLASGEEKIGGFYGATPVKGIPTKGTNGTTVLPWLVKQTPGKYAEPFSFKPRLLFKQAVKTIPNNEMYGTTTGSFSVPTGSTFYYIEDPAASGIRALNYYRTLLPTTDSPTIFSSSLDIHYSNIGYYPYQQSAVNGQCQDGVYNRYWAYYINSLYDIDARLLTCNIVLNPADIKNIKLNDKIFIDGHLYRINKIQGANLIQRQSTVVELIKLPTRTQPFTGRRRIPTGVGAEDYKDVIVNGFSDNGTVTYVAYDDESEIITDQQVLSYASTLDNFEAYADVVSWNTQQPTNINPNIIVLGNTKYNETQNNVIVVGAGNSIPDNLYGTSIFGDNNEINITSPTSSVIEQNLDITNNVIMASNTSIVDSNGIVLIQPSGSRTISNSQNNVLLNPINDISSSDPTGSVYTGNLRNQGTADFKQGATMTGSVDITGSFCVNGVCFPFPTGSGVTGSSVQFSHSFATDPTNEIFVTIPNPTGSNRAFALEYNLISGSLAINSGQLQINTDGNSAASVDVIVQRNLTGAPTASFAVTYTASVPPTLDVKATFIGSTYTISGSYVPLSGIYGNTGPQGPAGPSGSVDTGSFVTTSSFNAFTSSVVTTSSFNAFTSSVVTTSSFNTATGSFITTASVSLNTITFTKGNGTTFPITVNTGSGGGTFPFTGSAQITGSLGVTGSISNVRSGSIGTINNVIFGNGIRTGSASTGSIGIGTAFPSASSAGASTGVGNVFIVTNPNLTGGPKETALTNGDFNVVVGADNGFGITTGDGNTLIGTSGPPVTTQTIVTSVGYQNQPATIGSDNTILGSQIGSPNAYYGAGNIFVGVSTAYEAGDLSPTNNISQSIGVGNSALRFTKGHNNLALGHNAGNYVTGSNEFFVDMYDRGSYGGNKTGSLMYGQFNTTASAQMLTINSLLRLQPIATLPAAGTIGRLAVSGSSGNAKIYFDDGSTWNALF